MSSTVTINTEYAFWLQGLINSEEVDGRQYKKLLKTLGSREFYWTVPNDDNRLADGLKIRKVFFNEVVKVKPNMLSRAFSRNNEPCSVLEMLIGLAIRFDEAVMDSGGTSAVGNWFWLFMKNLGLDKYPDRAFDEEEVLHIIDVLLDRTYKPNGRGSLFPLRRTSKDARKVEIWYQMMAYLDENFEI